MQSLWNAKYKRSRMKVTKELLNQFLGITILLGMFGVSAKQIFKTGNVDFGARAAMSE